MPEKVTDVAYYLVQSDLTRYKLPRTRIREERIREREVASRRSPGARGAFAVGDLEWKPGTVRLTFQAMEASNAAIHALLGELRSACEDAIFLVRSANTEPILDGGGSPITDGDGNVIFASVGYGISILSWKAGTATEFVDDVESYRVVQVEWLARYGEPTAGTPDDLTAYDAYDKEF